MQTINKNIDINYLVQEAKENLDKYGFYIAKKIINKEKYLQARNNSILHFDNLEKEYRKLSYPLRGYVSAGMRDVSGLSNNEAWYLFRSCFFPWNRPNYNLRGLINISREISDENISGTFFPIFNFPNSWRVGISSSIKARLIIKSPE